MSIEPLVSIIIPCFNHGAFVTECVDSVLNQTYQNIEIIIVNDGSTDEDTINVLCKIQQPLIQIIHQENTGPGIARNNAIKIAKGKYFVPLDCDDLIEKNTINDCVKILEEKNRVGVVYGNCRYYGNEKKMLKQEPINLIRILNYNTVALCSVIRTEAFLSTGGFDEFLNRKGLEDWDLWLMMLEKNWVFEYINKVHFTIRILKTSRTFQVANKNLEEIKAYIYNKHSATLAQGFVSLYHENKNLKKLIDYKIGNKILKPFRWLNNAIFRK